MWQSSNRSSYLLRLQRNFVRGGRKAALGLILLLSSTSCTIDQSWGWPPSRYEESAGQTNQVNEVANSEPNNSLNSEAKNERPNVGKDEVKQFPTDIGWVNVQLDFGAKGDGRTDDTIAIKRALATVYADYTRPAILYFPAGTYVISQPLQFPTGRYKCCVTFQGQGQGQTVLQLRDRAAGFGDSTAPQAVIRTTEGNEAFRNYIRDLTIDTGRNNPGAIGIDYISNNRGAVKDVTIRSGDGTGKAGLIMVRRWPGPSLIQRVTIEGFETGIQVNQPEYGMVLENISLRGQKIAGIINQGNILAIHKLTSENQVPAIQNGINPGQEQGKAGLVLVIDGVFKGGNNAVSAIENNSYLYARNVKAEGYRSVITQQGQSIAGMTQAEYLSHKGFQLFNPATDRPLQSLQLPIEPTPMFHDNRLSHWANVADYPSLQSALDSGKAIVYWSQGQFQVNGTVRIPATVKKILGFETMIRGQGNAIWQVSERSDQPLIIEGLLLHNVQVDHKSDRTLVLQQTQLHADQGQTFRNAIGAGNLFLDDVLMDLQLDFPQQVWARQLNAESLDRPRSKIINRGGRLWILGLKTEGKGSVIETTDGGQTELLGTLIYPVQIFEGEERNQAAFISRESSQSLIYGISVYGEGRMYTIQVDETQNGVRKQLLTQQMNDRIMPLFLGRQNAH